MVGSLNLLKSIILSIVLVEICYADAMLDISNIEQNLSLKSTDTLLHDAKNLSINNKLQDALRISKYLLAKEPNNQEVIKLYAKLLFWNSKPKEAYEYIQRVGDNNSTLYRQIYITKSIKELKSIKESKLKIKYIENLDKFARDDYDIMWIEQQSFIYTSDMPSALKVAIVLKHKYPQSREANETVARLQFWNSKFKQSLTSYKELQEIYGKDSYIKEIEQLLNILKGRGKISASSTSKPYAILIAKIDKLYYDGKKNQAVILFQSQSNEVKNYIKSTYRLLYDALTMRHMIGVGVTKSMYSIDRQRDESFYIEGVFPISQYTLYAKLEQTHRYGKEDIRLLGELYPKLPKPFWGYISFSMTPEADFYSTYSLGWHQYYDIDKWEFGLGYDYSNYTADSTGIWSGEYSYTIDADLTIGQVLYYVPTNSSWAVINRIKYAKSNHTSWSVEYAISHSNEKIENSSIFSGTDSDKLKVSTETAINDTIHMGLDLSFKYFEGKNIKYNQQSIGIFIRNYW